MSSGATQIQDEGITMKQTIYICWNFVFNSLFLDSIDHVSLTLISKAIEYKSTVPSSHKMPVILSGIGVSG